jgi:hypothetical protein
MNKRIIPVAALVVVFALGFLYVNQNYLAAGDKDGKDCQNKSGCTSGNKDVKAGGDFQSYEFITDKACCDEMKASLQKDLMNSAGVKEVKFGTTCTSSKMTQVSVYYAAGETSSETISSFIKDKNYDCSGSGCTEKGCDKMGEKSGEKHEMKSGMEKGGCDGKNECPSMKQKSKDSKQL